jgi:hypothetical protein
VAGGGGNVAQGLRSFAAGHRAKALHNGTFVWGDSTGADVVSAANDQFVIRACGGVRLDDPSTSLYFGAQTRQMLNLWNTVYGIGVQNATMYFRTDGDYPDPNVGVFAWYRGGTHTDASLNPGGGQILMTLTLSGLTVNGAFVSSSDRAVKERVEPVNAREILERIAALPISRWQYTNDPGTRHIGPMAQDFHAAFQVGPDDKHITTIDADGVALAAIQGLNQKLEEVNAKLEQKDARIAALERKLAEVQEMAARWESRFTAMEHALARLPHVQSATVSATRGSHAKR